MPRNFSMQYYMIIAAIVILDQIVKKAVTVYMELNESLPVITDVFHITYIHNTGAAFSLMEGFRFLLIALPLLVILAALIYLFKKRKEARPALLLSLSFIAGGGLGNVIDRIALGYVVDYFDFRVFPIFNIADIFVCAGCALLVIYMLFMDGTHPQGRKNETDSSLQSKN